MLIIVNTYTINNIEVLGVQYFSSNSIIINTLTLYCDQNKETAVEALTLTAHYTNKTNGRVDFMLDEPSDLTSSRERECCC